MQRAILLSIAVLVANVPAIVCHHLAPTAPHWIWWVTSSVTFAGLVGLVAVAMEHDADGERDRG